MQGKIVWFRLDTGEGIIATDRGNEFPFTLHADQPQLQGGDIVEFDPVENGHGTEAQNIRLVQTCLDQLKQKHLPLVRQFFATIQFHRP